MSNCIFSKNFNCFKEAVHVAFAIVCMVAVVFGFLAFIGGIVAAFKFGMLAIISSSLVGLILMWGGLLSLICLMRNWKPQCFTEKSSNLEVDNITTTDKDNVKQSAANKNKAAVKKATTKKPVSNVKPKKK